MEEEGIRFEAGPAFYNPRMQLCRSIASLAVGAIGEKLSICDGFSASGIRGIRYAKENLNVESVDFVDINEDVLKLCRKNKAASKVKGRTYAGGFNTHLMNRRYGFVEIDPFGSPVPYAYFAIRSFRRKKEGYLSITATDTAILCGAHRSACLKYYHAHPLHNELCHEAGIRILLRHAAEIASEFDFGVSPIFSLSSRHFFKTILKLERGAKKAADTFAKTGHISYCNKCGFRTAGPAALQSCPPCSSGMEWAGPLWLGPLHDAKMLEKMEKLNEERSYADKAELAKLLGTMKEEDKFPPYFYDVHSESRRVRRPSLSSMQNAIENLKENGFTAARTHFRPTGIKTNAKIGEFLFSLR